MKLPEKEVIVRYVICGFFIVSLAYVFRNPFGYVINFKYYSDIWRLHSLTVVCMSILFLWFWSKMQNTPFSIRLFLTLLFCWIGFHNYDRIWVFDYITFEWYFSGGFLLQFFCNLITIYLLPLTILFYAGSYFKFVLEKEYHLPRISVKKFVFVLFINFVMILWLESTGFFPKVLQYRYGVGPDPHGWVWFFGKAIGTLCWIFAIEKRGKADSNKKQ